MSVFLDFKLTAPLPTELRPRLARLALIDDDGQGLTIPEMDRVTWADVFDSLEAHRCRLTTLAHLRIWETEFDWRSRYQETLGAVLDFDDAPLLANPPSDYLNPSCPPVDRILLPGRTPQFAERPNGHFFSVGGQFIASSKLLASLRIGESTEVVYQGNPLAGWRQFQLQTECSILSADCLSVVIPSALCGHSLLCRYGIWFCTEADAEILAVVVDRLHFGHLQQERVVVIPPALALDLKKPFRSLQLLPVYRLDSPIVSLFRAALARATALVSFSAD